MPGHATRTARPRGGTAGGRSRLAGDLEPKAPHGAYVCTADYSASRVSEGPGGCLARTHQMAGTWMGTCGAPASRSWTISMTAASTSTS